MPATDTRRYDGLHCTMQVESPAPRLVLLRISGRDIGEFGARPMRDVERLLGDGNVRLFIDARDTNGASVEVSNDWAQWLSRHRARLAQVHMLTGSKFIRITAEFVRRFAALGDLMEIHASAADFDAALSRARTEGAGS